MVVSGVRGSVPDALAEEDEQQDQPDREQDVAETGGQRHDNGHLAADHALARRDSVSVEDLADVPLVTIAGNIPQGWLDHHLPTSTPAGQPVPQGPAVTYWPEVLSLVAAGRGVTPVSARAAKYHTRPGVAFVPFADAPPVEYGLLWPTSSATNRVRAFVRAACEVAGLDAGGLGRDSQVPQRLLHPGPVGLH
ncbi:LysR substrate-binding domain-containing protein [Solihabitans fulvus]|nr:LysR substrate-binding domain-containing protein [Solihabitans fulvus]